MIYFFYSPVRNEIKIGKSNSTSKRILGLTTMAPDGFLVGEINESEAITESSIHTRFEKFRIYKKRELFESVPEIWDFIDSLKKTPLVIKYIENEIVNAMREMISNKITKLWDRIKQLPDFHLYDVTYDEYKYFWSKKLSDHYIGLTRFDEFSNYLAPFGCIKKLLADIHNQALDE